MQPQVKPHQQLHTSHMSRSVCMPAFSSVRWWRLHRVHDLRHGGKARRTWEEDPSPELDRLSCVQIEQRKICTISSIPTTEKIQIFILWTWTPHMRAWLSPARQQRKKTLPLSLFAVALLENPGFSDQLFPFWSRTCMRSYLDDWFKLTRLFERGSAFKEPRQPDLSWLIGHLIDYVEPQSRSRALDEMWCTLGLYLHNSHFWYLLQTE